MDRRGSKFHFKFDALEKDEYYAQVRRANKVDKLE